MFVVDLHLSMWNDIYVGREGSAIKLKDFYPHQVFLVKKSKDVKNSKMILNAQW